MSAFAKNANTVSSDNVNTKQGESFTIPIRLENNKGIMGFKITVEYPNEKLTLTDVSSGSVTNGGLFNTTVMSYAAVNGSFDVVWSDIQDFTDDGTLFMLTFSVSEIADDCICEIELSYSQEDTFNENWEDVKLNCKSVSVRIGEPKETLSPETTEQTAEKNEDKKKVQVSDDYLISSVKSVLTSFGVADIEKVKDEQKPIVLEFVNNKLKSYDENVITFSSFEELKAAYNIAVKNQAEKLVNDSVDSNIVIDKADEVLNEFGADSFKDVPADKKEDAVDKMLNSLSENNAEVHGFNDVTNSDDAAEVLDSIVENAIEQENSGIPVQQEDNADTEDDGTLKIIIFVIIAVIVVVVVIVMLMINKKKRGVHNEKTDE